MSMPLLTSSQKTKAKKTVRFKSDQELVSIREIETRWEREEWQPDRNDSEDQDMESDAEQDYNHTELEMPYPLEDDSVMNQERQARPEFNLPGDQIAALVRGDFWYRPPLVSLEGIDIVNKVIVSTEYDYQARRELSTPPAMDNAPMDIQLTPTEPTSPTLPSDFMDTRTMPLYEVSLLDIQYELERSRCFVEKSIPDFLILHINRRILPITLPSYSKLYKWFFSSSARPLATVGLQALIERLNHYFRLINSSSSNHSNSNHGRSSNKSWVS